MATFKRFEEIVAWKEARELARIVYNLTRNGALSKDFGMRDQIQRAAVSVGSNIAEGFARSGNKEFLNFLWISHGSAAEVQSQLYTILDAGYISEHEFDEVYDAGQTFFANLAAGEEEKCSNWGMFESQGRRC